MARKQIDMNYFQLKDMYILRKMPVGKIAKFFNVSNTHIYKHLKRFGLIENENIIRTTKEEHCKKCIYRGKLTITGEVMCNYASVVGSLRNCSPRHCEYFQKGSQKRGVGADA